MRPMSLYAIPAFFEILCTLIPNMVAISLFGKEELHRVIGSRWWLAAKSEADCFAKPPA